VPDASGAVRYRFGEFTLSRRRRLLLRGGVPVPLIPKYFDLLRLLIERREDALDRREIFDRVWSDVIVSDGALSQAIRTLRRALDDDPRAPRYIRTVSRHGYQFVFEPVIVEEDDAAPARNGWGPASPDSSTTQDRWGPASAGSSTTIPADKDAQYEALIARVLGEGPHRALSDDERREAAEQLHTLGTREALERLDEKPGHARARALLRDSRWDVPDAGDVPLVGAPAAARSMAALAALRLRGAARAAGRRLGLAATGGAIAGTVGGAVGGSVLMLPAESPATFSTLVALMIIGGLAGTFGAAALGAGLAAAEVLARARRRLALALCGVSSGLLAGTMAHLAVRAVFESVVGRPPTQLGGPLEGSVVGFAAGVGYAWSTRTPHGGGMATPHGIARLRAGLGTALCCAAAGAALGAMGGTTVSVTLDTIGSTYSGSQVGLAPLAHVLGEQELRPVTRALVSAFEGLLFGFGLALGLTHRPTLMSADRHS
jgi:DNA-binding winged helix-turn-helix (wHTH) protein